jgi:hypothetical protein
MRDNELRGIILEALYNQRRKDLVDFETELGKLPLPDTLITDPLESRLAFTILTRRASERTALISI